jgi:hypothetical protein
MHRLFQHRDHHVHQDLVSMEMLLAFRLEQILPVLRHLCAAEDVVLVVHHLVVSRPFQRFFRVWVHQDVDVTCLEQMKMDCCQVLPLDVECPFPAQMRMGYFPVLEFQLAEIGKARVLQQAFQSLVRASLPQREFQLQPFLLWLLP